MNGRLHLFVIFLCIALFPGGGWVKEDSGESLEKRVKNLEQENQALKEMIRQLVDGQEAVVRTARELLPVAEKAGDQPTVDLLSARMMVHEQNAWMLRSLLED